MWEWSKTLNEISIAGNELWRVGGLAASILVALIVTRVGQALLGRMADRWDERRPILAAVDRSAARGLPPIVFTLGLKIGLQWLFMPQGLETLLGTVMSVLMTLSVAWLIFCQIAVVDTWLSRFVAKTESKLDDMIAPMVRKTLKVTVVTLTLVQVAQVLSDKPITSILAGLGVGGLAVALAAQDTIKNFFGSLVIFADKPFELGDRIKTGSIDGSVEEVGFRSTRIRTLEGNLVAIPNGDLANQTIENVTKRPHIRRIMNVTITYDTPPEKIDRALEILKELLADHEGMHPDFPPRVFFNEFNSDSLNLIAVYWYHPAAWWDYMAFSEQLNKNLFRRYGEEGIEFAFPTQTLFLAGDPGRPLHLGSSESKNG